MSEEEDEEEVRNSGFGRVSCSFFKFTFICYRSGWRDRQTVSIIEHLSARLWHVIKLPLMGGYGNATDKDSRARTRALAVQVHPRRNYISVMRGFAPFRCVGPPAKKCHRKNIDFHTTNENMLPSTFGSYHVISGVTGDRFR